MLSHIRVLFRGSGKKSSEFLNLLNNYKKYPIKIVNLSDEISENLSLVDQQDLMMTKAKECNSAVIISNNKIETAYELGLLKATKPDLPLYLINQEFNTDWITYSQDFHLYKWLDSIADINNCQQKSGFHGFEI